MPTLHKPKLEINTTSTSSTADVKVSALVEFDSSDLAFIETLGVKFKLSCELRGDDDWPSDDDDLYWFTSKSIDKSNAKSSHTYTFKKTISRSYLDEDSWPSGDDEVYARVKLKSTSSFVTYSKSKDSDNVSGSY